MCPKRLIRGVFLIQCLAIALLWWMPAEAGQKVAKVSGAVLTQADFDLAMQDILPAAMFHGGISDEKRAKYRPRAIEKMIEDELLYQEAGRKGMKVRKDRIEDLKKGTIKRLGGKKQFRQALKQWGYSEKEYERRLEKNILLERIIDAEINQKAKVSDEEARAYYEENKKTYKRPEARRLSHIVIKVDPSSTDEVRREKMDRAEEVLEKLKAGGDFAQLAWDYSDGQYRVKGGDLGLLHIGRLTPDIEKEVWKLKKGELSGIIKALDGFHIFRVEDVKKSEQLDYEDVAQGIKQKLEEKRKKKLKEELMSRLKKNAEIEVFE